MIVAIKHKLFTGKSPAQELSDDFRAEIKEMMKKVAHEHHCNVNDLKFTVNNMGVVNIRSLTPDEIIERDKNG